MHNITFLHYDTYTNWQYWKIERKYTFIELIFTLWTTFREMIPLIKWGVSAIPKNLNLELTLQPLTCLRPLQWALVLTLRLLMSYIYIYIYMEHLFLMFLDHTQRHTTVGRTPLDEWSALRRDLYLTTHDTHNRQIFRGVLPTVPRRCVI